MPYKVGFRYIFIIAIVLLGLNACSPGSVVIPALPTRQVGWSVPTPFPPMKYATEEPSYGLPPGIQGHGASVPATGSQQTTANFQGKFQQQLLNVELETAKLRGLKPLVDVPEHLITKTQLRDNMLALRDKSYTREEARQSEIQLWLLRLVERPKIDLFQLQASLLSEEVAGYYDPWSKRLYVINDGTQFDPASRQTLAHEFVHSLQDQHFDLQRILAASNTGDDGYLAAKSIVEGDATLAELLYADQYFTANEFQKITGKLAHNVPPSSTPNIFREQLYFPYTYGLKFAQTLYTRGGFDTINRALENPPRSTEQIMHPEKYLAAQRDDPLPVGLPPLTDTLGTGWTYRMSKTVGEFELGVMLKDHGISTADDAVKGWGGGQADLYENGADSLVMLGTRWDTVADAVKFESALRSSLSDLTKSGSLWTDVWRFFNVRRVGDKVIFVGGTNPATVTAAPRLIK